MRILSLILKVFSHWIAVSFLLILLTTVDSFGQYKYEKESRIHSSELPFQLDLDFDAYAGVKRLKWYKELNVDQVHYEAKFRFEGSDYSVEFDSLGLLEDVEILCKSKDLPVLKRTSIEQYLNTNYKKWKITRAQKQYLIDFKTLDLALKGAKLLSALEHQYELEIGVFEDGVQVDYELLFNFNGTCINIRTIINEPLLNLEF